MWKGREWVRWTQTEKRREGEKVIEKRGQGVFERARLTQTCSLLKRRHFLHTDTDGHSNTLSTDTQEKLRHPLLFVAVVLLCPGLFTTADVCKRGQSYVKEFTFLLPAKTGDWGRTPSRIMRGIAVPQMAVRMMVHNPLQWVRRDTLEGNFNKGEKTKTWLDEKDQ